MGHLNDHDPANTRAITRSRLGLVCDTRLKLNSGSLLYIYIANVGVL